MKSDFFLFSFSFSCEIIIPGSQFQFSVLGKVAQCFQDSPLHMEGASTEMPYRFSLLCSRRGASGSEVSSLGVSAPQGTQNCGPSASGSHLISVLWSLTVLYSGLPAFFFLK